MNNQTTEIQQFLKSKGFTQKSIKTYISIILKVTTKIGQSFTDTQLENLFTTLNLTPRSYNLYRTVMNFYTKKYLNYELKFTKAKVEKSLPTHVTKEEFKQLMDTIPNFKHRIGFMLMYFSGLRVYEVCRVKRHDINLDTFTLLVKEGKGRKDRHAIIPKTIIKDFEIYLNTIKNDNPYLFQTHRIHISERSFQERLKKAIKDAKLTKQFTCHDLRHSYAINLLNSGVDIEVVRKTLGHSSLRTTQIYLQCRTVDLQQIAARM